ncbi:MAG: prolipoprotein diacylglyceryl transferase [Mucinivorans sp.]
MNFLVVTWNVDPVFFSLFGIDIAYYGLLWVAAFVVGAYVFGKMVQSEGLNPDMTDSAFMYMLIATIIGARLGHCFFYEPAYYLANPWQILNLRAGGLASHGAAVGMALGIFLYARHWKIPALWLFDRVGIVVAVGGALIRMGNLLNSEIYGTATDMPWGFIFVRAGETMPMHPTQIYEALAYMVIFFILMHLYWRTNLASRRGVMFGVFLILLFGMRLWIESIKQVQEPWEAALPLNMGQMLSIPFIVVGFGILIWALMRPAKPYINMPRPKKRSPKAEKELKAAMTAKAAKSSKAEKKSSKAEKKK